MPDINYMLSDSPTPSSQVHLSRPQKTVRMGFALDLWGIEELEWNVTNGMHAGINANSRNLEDVSLFVCHLLCLVNSSLPYADNCKICVPSLDLSSKLQTHIYLSIYLSDICHQEKETLGCPTGIPNLACPKLSARYSPPRCVLFSAFPISVSGTFPVAWTKPWSHL